MKNSFDERNLKEINNWLKASKKIALATVIRCLLYTSDAADE